MAELHFDVLCEAWGNLFCISRQLCSPLNYRTLEQWIEHCPPVHSTAQFVPRVLQGSVSDGVDITNDLSETPWRLPTTWDVMWITNNSHFRDVENFTCTSTPFSEMGSWLQTSFPGEVRSSVARLICQASPQFPPHCLIRLRFQLWNSAVQSPVHNSHFIIILHHILVVVCNQNEISWR